MLYKILKWLLYLTNRAYFRSIYIKGEDVVPETGPVIFSANHPSAFMDPILLGVNIKRQLYFLARGDLFKNKIIRRIFKALHMIPVYKSDLSPDQMHKNEAIFDQCYDHLANGRPIMIFPEGTSRTERRLRPVKTGISRIALGAEAKYNFDLDVVIIPIGINYSNPHYFKSDVFVYFGEPIKVSDYFDAYQKDDRKAVVALTERIKSEMEDRMVIIEDERFDKIIRQIEILYRSKLRDDRKSEDKGSQDFYLSKDIVKAVEYYAEHHPDTLADFEARITEYLKRIKRLNIRDTQVRSSAINLNLLWKLTYFVFGFPVFCFGFLTNVIPFKLVEFILKKIPVREDFQGSINMAVGMVIFLIIYSVETFGVYHFTGFFWWSLLFLISLYPAGLFTITYIKTYYQTRGTLKYLNLFIRKSDLITKLKSQRQGLVDILEEAKATYLKHRDQH